MAAKYMKNIRKVAGIQSWQFDKDGKHFEGASISTLEDIDPKQGMGKSAEKISMSKAKLDDLGFDVLPGQTVQVVYNRYGRIDTLVLVDDTDFDTDFDS